jgi:hypothetical protein
MVEVVLKNNYFGVIEDGVEVVPFVHYTKKSAIDEWVLFQKLNTIERQFLNSVISVEDIEKIEHSLINRAHINR